MIYWLIYAAGYLYTIKFIFMFIYNDFLHIDSVDLVFISLASSLFAIFWPLIWLGKAADKHLLKPIIAELERKRNEQSS